MRSPYTPYSIYLRGTIDLVPDNLSCRLGTAPTGVILRASIDFFLCILTNCYRVGAVPKVEGIGFMVRISQSGESNKQSSSETAKLSALAIAMAAL